MSTLVLNEGKTPKVSFHWNTYPTTFEKIESVVGKPNHKVSKAQNAWSLTLVEENGDSHNFTLYDDFGSETYKKKEIVVWLIGCEDETEGKLIELALRDIL